MAAGKSVFDELIAKGVRNGQLPGRTTAARTWYRNAAKGIGAVNENSLLRGKSDRLSGNIAPGSMYLFRYSPKHEATLPYYDRVPLIFPFEMTGDGFYGINLHYLPLELRAKLMDGLYKLASDKRYDESTTIQLSYGLLKSSARLRYFKPCVKRYLSSHVRSQFMYVYPSEWDIALFLPLARFEKRSIGYVHDQSRQMISG